MCSYSWGIKCGIRDFIGRSEGRLEGGGRLWLPEWLLKGGACRWDRNRDMPGISCPLSFFGLLAWPIQYIYTQFKWKENNNFRLSTFSLSPSTSPSWQAGGWLSITQVNKWTLARGEDISLNWGTLTRIETIPIADLSSKLKWVQKPSPTKSAVF